MNTFTVSITGAIVIVASMRGLTRGYDTPAEQVPEIPAVQTASFEQAATWLTSRVTTCGLEINAAHRLGVIGGSNALNLLLTSFWQRAYYHIDAYDVGPNTIKLDIIRVIGKFHTPEAKQALLAIAKSYWAAGPHKSSHNWIDHEFRRVVVMTAHELERWAGDDDVHAYAESVTGSRRFRNVFSDEGFGEICRAYLIKLREVGEMKRNGTISPAEIAQEAAMRLAQAQEQGRKGRNPPADVDIAMKVLIAGLPQGIKTNLCAQAQRDYDRIEARIYDLSVQASQQRRWTDDLKKQHDDLTPELLKYRALKDYLSMTNHCGLPYCLPLE